MRLNLPVFAITGILCNTLSLRSILRPSILCWHAHHCHETAEIRLVLYDGQSHVHVLLCHLKRSEGTFHEHASTRATALYNNLHWIHLFDSVFYLFVWRNTRVCHGPECVGGAAHGTVVVSNQFFAWGCSRPEIRHGGHGPFASTGAGHVRQVSSLLFGRVF
jgi:hypothetical protein